MTHNCTGIPFAIAVSSNRGIHDVGLCSAKSAHNKESSRDARDNLDRKSFVTSENVTSSVGTHKIPSLGIPANLIPNFEARVEELQTNYQLTLLICPCEQTMNGDIVHTAAPSASRAFYDGVSIGVERWGAIMMPDILAISEVVHGNDTIHEVDILCKTKNSGGSDRRVQSVEDSMNVKVIIKVSLVDGAYPKLGMYILLFILFSWNCSFH
mmetsp:Transcript_10313/g.10394  ORF Transcript_10313/g.10394 Transcript_10313/m.10394 type:complete len:211 (-) Transcript_10313:111-743(-)